jgi:alpha-tubulin suppressor-like RCC1 family protein
MATRTTGLILTVLFLAVGTGDVAAGVAASVAAGSYHTCAVTPTGGVMCWGRNDRGQLGDGTTTNRWTPAPVTGLSVAVAAVTAGRHHTCALTTGGGVVCWGYNSDGQLGDGTTAQHLTPVPVGGLGSGVAAIAAGAYHTCALTTGGGVVCWGANGYGQVGDGTTTPRPTPTAVSGLGSGVAALAAGRMHTCALTNAGSVKCWGYNASGQLGDGTTTNRSTPTGVSGLGNGVVAVAAGEGHSCALTTDGAVLCWGFNMYGQLGDGSAIDRSIPASVIGLPSAIAAITAGPESIHTCGRTTAGGVLCWGANADGQLGDGTTDDRYTPAPVSGLGHRVTGIAAGSSHTCALADAGAVVCWGASGYGQVGDGTQLQRLTPASVAGMAGNVAPDFNGDWRADILWRHATRGEVWLWPMDGVSRTSQVHLRTVSEPGWEIRGLGDQNGDGRANILWRHGSTGMLYLWTIAWWNGIPFLVETYVETVDPAYDIVGTGDYNGDGKSDILWRHLTNGDLWVWLMNGTTVVSSTYVATVDPGYAVVGSGDLNGDAKADIVWRHKTNGEVWVWLMNGATPTAMTYVTTVGDLGYQVVAVADHAGDGKADILWWHSTRGEVWLWPMDGTTRLTETLVSTVADTGYRIVGSGDYNGDGTADILWHHVTRGEVWVWPMSGATRLTETKVATVPDTGYQIVK